MSGKKLPVKIFFVDESKMRTVAVESSTKARDLVKLLAEKEELPPDQYDRFKLFLQKQGEERCLDDAEEPLSIMVWETSGADQNVLDHQSPEAWGKVKNAWETTQQARFVFKYRIFLQETLPENENFIKLLYDQAIHDVRYGVIRPSMEDLVSLAGLQMQVDFKDHDPSKYTKDFLAGIIGNLIPQPLIPENNMDTWQDLIYKEHRKNLGMNQYSAERAYLDIASKQPLYGATLWRVKLTNALDMKLPENLYLAVYCEGILLLADTPQREELMKHSFSDIYSWAYKHSAFAFVSGTVSKQKFQFETRYGKEIANTLQAYVNVLMSIYTANKGEGSSGTSSSK